MGEFTGYKYGTVEDGYVIYDLDGKQMGPLDITQILSAREKEKVVSADDDVERIEIPRYCKWCRNEMLAGVETCDCCQGAWAGKREGGQMMSEYYTATLNDTVLCGQLE